LLRDRTDGVMCKVVIKDYSVGATLKMKTHSIRTYEIQQRKVYSHECIYQKHRKISNKQPSVTSQTSRKMRKV
jgi:hypothetical protein